jgi:hypothetical protein
MAVEETRPPRPPEEVSMAAISKEERFELESRASLIGMYQRTVALLESERRLFLSHLLTEKGLDPAKEYTLNPETGELTENEEPSG